MCGRSCRCAKAANRRCPFAGTSRDGSDGTRTRDLRRDRPSPGRRRPATRPSDRPHLQAFSALMTTPPRMVEPIVAPPFGPRVGHEMLSGVTTNHTPLWVADAHRASSLEVLLTMSSVDSLCDAPRPPPASAKTDTHPPRHTPRRLTPSNTVREYVRTYGSTRPLFPKGGGKVSTGVTTACSPLRARGVRPGTRPNPGVSSSGIRQALDRSHMRVRGFFTGSRSYWACLRVATGRE
jgi:hypothetical protein